MAWNRAGDTLASSSEDQQIRVWEMSSPPADLSVASMLASNWTDTVLEGDNGWVNWVAWSPTDDGKLVACADNTLRVWERNAFGSVLTLDTHPYGVTNNLRFSPHEGGRWVAAAQGVRLAGDAPDAAVQVRLAAPSHHITWPEECRYKGSAAATKAASASSWALSSCLYSCQRFRNSRRRAHFPTVCIRLWSLSEVGHR